MYFRRRNGLTDEHTHIHTQQVGIRTHLTHVQYARGDLSPSSFTSLSLVLRGTRLPVQKCAGGTNERLSEKSSHCTSVNCQRWYGAEALLLPADKVSLMRSAEPLRLSARLDEGKRGYGRLQRHPLGDGFLRLKLLTLSLCW